jgi:hypothetical protein
VGLRPWEAVNRQSALIIRPCDEDLLRASDPNSEDDPIPARTELGFHRARLGFDIADLEPEAKMFAKAAFHTSN